MASFHSIGKVEPLPGHLPFHSMIIPFQIGHYYTRTRFLSSIATLDKSGRKEKEKEEDENSKRASASRSYRKPSCLLYFANEKQSNCQKAEDLWDDASDDVWDYHNMNRRH